MTLESVQPETAQHSSGGVDNNGYGATEVWPQISLPKVFVQHSSKGVGDDGATKVSI